MVRTVKAYSFADLSRIYEIPVCVDNAPRISETEHDGTDAKWYGGIKSQADAVALLKGGWSEGADKAKKLAIELEKEIPAPQSRRRRQVWGEDGHTLDVDRAMAGDWDHAWRTSRREISTGSQIVDLVFSWGGNADVEASPLFWTGAAAIAITDLLESAGYAVKVTAAIGSVNSHRAGEVLASLVTLKENDQPLRLDALASVACHAGVFRTFGFRTILHAPFTVQPGLGRHVPLSGLSGLLPEGSLQIDDCRSREDAIRVVREIVKRVSNGSEVE